MKCATTTEQALVEEKRMNANVNVNKCEYRTKQGVHECTKHFYEEYLIEGWPCRFFTGEAAEKWNRMVERIGRHCERRGKGVVKPALV